MCGFRIVEISKRNSFIVYPYSCTVFLTSFMPTYATKSRFRNGFFMANIMCILKRGRFPKIFNSIVVFDLVYMVYDLFREISVHIKPSKAVCENCLPINFYPYIPHRGFAACDTASNSIGNSNVTRKNPSIRFIMNNFFQSFLRKHLILRNSNLNVVGNRLITAVERLANPVPTIGIIT